MKHLHMKSMKLGVAQSTVSSQMTWLKSSIEFFTKNVIDHDVLESDAPGFRADLVYYQPHKCHTKSFTSNETLNSNDTRRKRLSALLKVQIAVAECK